MVSAEGIKTEQAKVEAVVKFQFKMYKDFLG